jgi:hypothetical protein
MANRTLPYRAEPCPARANLTGPCLTLLHLALPEDPFMLRKL